MTEWYRYSVRFDARMEAYVREQAEARGCTKVEVVKAAIESEMAEAEDMRNRNPVGRAKLCQKCGGPNIAWRSSRRCPACPTYQQDRRKRAANRYLEQVLQSCELDRGTGCIEPDERVVFGQNHISCYGAHGKAAGGFSAPRLAYEAYYDDVLLVSERVWRKCDNRRCINAEHMMKYKAWGRD